MSLFKSREWWATVVGEEEQFDLGCLCLANIDNSATGTDKIVVGSFHGFVRIYNPRPHKGEDGAWSGFRPEDVLVETQLQYPILQLEAGIFIAGSDKLQLAVLHPRKLAVYQVIGSTGSVEHGSHHQLKLAYEHNLSRTAFNFCYGQFGGAKGRDFLCVQSMDGTVSVYEQETFAFSRFLPGALLPGPIRYVPKTDSFVTVSSSRQVESYKYQVLAVATDAKSKEESQNIKSGKKVAHDWAFNIGEQALDVFVTTFSSAPVSIFVLGERNLVCLTELGKLRFIKKYDYNPSCFTPYVSVSEGTINCIIGTHTKTLMVYQDITLKWAAQLTQTPVQVAVGNFQDLSGVIVSLDEEGHLQCSYLGTEPALFSPPTAELREINYDAQDREMAMLQKQIRALQHKGLPMPSAKADEDVTLIAVVSHELDEMSRAQETEVQDEDPIPSIAVKIQVKSRTSVNNVQIHIHAPAPLSATESLLTFPSIDSSRPAETRVSFYMKQQMCPADLSADITATYTTVSGAPRVAHSVVKMPLRLVVKPVLPVKNATFKITIDSNKPPVNLNDIFPDLLGESAGGQGNALGFQAYGGPVVTVLASKTSQRYRLQCDAFEAMWPVLSELISRLHAHHAAKKMSDFCVTYEGQLPLQEYFDVLDRHFDYRQTNEKYRKLLEERAVQFRAVQRRLLTRFKDKTPAPLTNLDTLLDGTYRQILNLADGAAENSRLEAAAAADLSAATRLLNTLIRYWTGLNDAEFSVLQSVLSPVVADNGEQGWEESVDAAVTHLLRTCLAKSAKDQTVNPAPLGILKETTKLKKHIALLCDRLSKGAKLAIEGADTSTTPERHAPIPAASTPRAKKGRTSGRAEVAAPGLEEADRAVGPLAASMQNGEYKDGEMPIGSKFGENKAPKPKKRPVMAVNGDAHSAPDLLADSGRTPQLGPSRSDRDLSPNGGALPLLQEQGRLPPMEEDNFGKGNKFLKKQKNSAQNSVPDLDELEAAAGDEDGRLLNSSGAEMLFSV